MFGENDQFFPLSSLRIVYQFLGLEQFRQLFPFPVLTGLSYLLCQLFQLFQSPDLRCQFFPGQGATEEGLIFLFLQLAARVIVIQ